jgi:hypothetical protein
MPSAKVNMDFPKNDLNNDLVDSIEFYSNAAYRLKPELTNDLIVALVRMNTLAVPSSKEFVKIEITMIAIRNKQYIDESKIRNKLTKDELDQLDKTFPGGLVGHETIDQVVSGNEYLSQNLTCSPQIVDAHWAWFSATGDTRVIDKLIESSKVKNTPCCFSCIEWSIPSQAKSNEDVYKYLIEFKKNLGEKSQQWFSRYVPDLRECDWINYYKIENNKDSLNKLQGIN